MDKKATFIIVSTEAEKEAAFAIRIRIFCQEQGYPEETEIDDRDQTCTHILALTTPAPHLSQLPSFPPLVAIGTARVYLKRVDGKVVGRIGRVAVALEARGIGAGAGVMIKAEEALKGLLKESGEDECFIELHAQVPKKGFYEKLGYEAFGDEYDEDGAPHISMRKHLKA
ncbi:hypothetical protein HDU97_001613 [Phlyctochytrium planicorne]|nr:hypothetical protein HDU97_001613 [Phlyctochytrium planicorne]